MNRINTYISAFVFHVMCLSAAHATMVEFSEDPYSVQAPQEIVDLAHTMATKVGFDAPYEIVTPKTPAIQVNPWNKFIGTGINPLTKNSLVLVNTNWFSHLNTNQQQALLARCFVQLKLGISPFILKIIPHLYFFLELLFAFFVFRLLRKIFPSGNQSKSAMTVFAVFATVCILVVCELWVFDPLKAHTVKYIALKHEHKIHETVIEKTLDRVSLIEALTAIDLSIKNEWKNGEIFWAPYLTTFEQYAAELQTEKGYSAPA